MEFFTIGVYNSTEQEFFNKLTGNKIDTFGDIRQRRGVRGAKYAFANSARLQNKLNELGITYGHETGLAPTQKIRLIQNDADTKNHELKRDRQHLDPAFLKAYKENVLNVFDFDAFLDKLRKMKAQRIVLFCIEEHAEACHRSVVTQKLQEKYGFKITNL